MLKNAKSLYFIQILFSFICKKNKLKLVKYYKNLQSNMNISINNYIHFKCNYIEYETNGKGKEYHYYNQQQNLVFEGEYKNGERNGKWKEYEGGILAFEGGYKNGKINGKGKEYFYNNNLMFECEYLNDKRNEKGKEYDYDGKLLFEGDYLNDLRNGKGKEYYINDNLRFEGEYLNNQQWEGKGYDNLNKIAYELHNGKGYVKIYNDGWKLIFEGEYLNGERNGKGRNIFVRLDYYLKVNI